MIIYYYYCCIGDAMKSNLGNTLEKVLKEQGMSQKELAKKADITEAAVSHYIKGDRVPRSTTLGLLAGALGVTAGFLLGAGVTSAAAERNKQTFEEAKVLLKTNSRRFTKEQRLELISILSLGGQE